MLRSAKVAPTQGDAQDLWSSKNESPASVDRQSDSSVGSHRLCSRCTATSETSTPTSGSVDPSRILPPSKLCSGVSLWGWMMIMMISQLCTLNCAELDRTSARRVLSSSRFCRLYFDSPDGTGVSINQRRQTLRLPRLLCISLMHFGQFWVCKRPVFFSWLWWPQSVWERHDQTLEQESCDIERNIV